MSVSNYQIYLVMNRSIKWYFRRHPLLYKIRFRLVSKKSTVNHIENFSYNNINNISEIPKIYFALNKLVFSKVKTELTDVEKAQRIAVWLRNHIKGGPGLGNSSETALRKMMNGEGGVCSDFSQVFNNFCVINNVKVKEWGLKIISKDPSILGGHSFNEVYSKEFKKWVLIDVTKSILFYNSSSNIPLSVLDLINLKKEKHEIRFVPFNKKIMIDAKRINDLYLIPGSFPFLITNYNNKIYDYYLNKLEFLPESFIHGLIYLRGKSYNYEFPI